MEQSSCAVTSLRRAARPYLLIPRLKKHDKQVQHLWFFPCECQALSRSYYWSWMLSKDISVRGTFFREYYDTVKSGAALELRKAGIWRNGLYLCLGKPEPSPEMTPSFLFAAEAN